MENSKKSKKIVILVASLIVVAILIIVSILLLMRTKNKLNNNDKTSKNNYIAYIKINPLVKFELTQTCQGNNCEDPLISSYELVNDDAKEMYKEVEFKGKTILDIIPVIADITYGNNINYNNINISTDWKEIYSNEEIEKIIAEKSKYNKEYNVTIDIDENLEDKEMPIEKIETKELKIVPLAINNIDTLYKVKDETLYYTIRINDGNDDDRITSLNLKLFGSKDYLDKIDENDLSLVMDVNKYYDKDVMCGIHEIRPYLQNLNEDIYYTLEPSTYKIAVRRNYSINIKNISKKEFNSYLEHSDCNLFDTYFYYDNTPVAHCLYVKWCEWNMLENETPKNIINYAEKWMDAKFTHNNFSFNY